MLQRDSDGQTAVVEQLQRDSADRQLVGIEELAAAAVVHSVAIVEKVDFV